MRIDKQHILAEIKRTAQANNGVPLGIARFSQEIGIQVTDWEGKLWVRWGDALREAGFEPNQFTTAYDEGTLIEKFISPMRELRRFPLLRELEMKRRLGYSAFCMPHCTSNSAAFGYQGCQLSFSRMST
jgi:hypothetical protein